MKLDLEKAGALAEEFALALAAGDDARGLIMRAVAEHDASWRKGDTDRLSIHGVTSSCTCGPHGLLFNWIGAVFRKTGKVVA